MNKMRAFDSSIQIGNLRSIIDHYNNLIADNTTNLSCCDDIIGYDDIKNDKCAELHSLNGIYQNALIEKTNSLAKYVALDSLSEQDSATLLQFYAYTTNYTTQLYTDIVANNTAAMLADSSLLRLVSDTSISNEAKLMVGERIIRKYFV
jgi:hypothetical protein